MLTSSSLEFDKKKKKTEECQFSLILVYLQLPKPSLQPSIMLLLLLPSIFLWSILSSLMELWGQCEVLTASNRHLCHRSHSTFKSHFPQVQYFKLSKQSMKKKCQGIMQWTEMLYQRKYYKIFFAPLELNYQCRLYKF